MLTAAIEWSQLWGSPLEMFAVITGVICVALITFENFSRKLAWWNWPIGALTSAAYIFVFWDYGLYFNSVLQGFYVLAAFYGAWAWKCGGEQKTELLVRKTPPLIAAAWFGTAIAAAAGLAFFGDNLFGLQFASPFWDALVVTFSLAAQFIMTRKFKIHWLFWIAVDVVGVALFASQGLPLTAILYFIYGCLCVRGIFTWRAANAAVLLPAAGGNVAVPKHFAPIEEVRREILGTEPHLHNYSVPLSEGSFSRKCEYCDEPQVFTPPQ